MSALNTLFKALMSVVLVSLCAYGLIALSSLWLFAKPSIQLGQAMTIATSQVNVQANTTLDQKPSIHLMSGWAYPESWGTWSIADKATFSLPKPPSNSKSLVLEVRALVASKHPEQVVRLMIHGQLRSSATLSKEDGNQIIIPVEAGDFSGDRLAVELQLPNLISPSALGIGKDDRQLAIGLRSVRYQ
jgi:hypothetical protein